MANGILTIKAASVLQKELDQQGFDVLHDHGKREEDPENKLGKLRSWFRDQPHSRKILADLDIAVLLQNSDKVYALIEIEETTSKPKAILGDVMGTLLGHGIVFQTKRNLEIGKWTTLLVMASDSHKTQGSRMEYLAGQADAIKTKLKTPNARIGRVVIDTFANYEELEGGLRKYIHEAINAGQTR